MAEAVNALCELISLTKFKEEKLVVDLELLEEVFSKGEKCLLVKLHINRHFNIEAFKVTMKQI